MSSAEAKVIICVVCYFYLVFSSETLLSSLISNLFSMLYLQISEWVQIAPNIELE